MFWKGGKRAGLDIMAINCDKLDIIFNNRSYIVQAFVTAVDTTEAAKMCEVNKLILMWPRRDKNYLIYTNLLQWPLHDRLDKKIIICIPWLDT